MIQKTISTFRRYEELSGKFCDKEAKDNILLLTVGLCGESGEVAEKIKRVFWHSDGNMKKTDVTLLEGELGDILWYVSELANSIGSSLESVANTNLEKLSGRHARGTIKGYGDMR